MAPCLEAPKPRKELMLQREQAPMAYAWRPWCGGRASAAGALLGGPRVGTDGALLGGHEAEAGAVASASTGAGCALLEAEKPSKEMLHR